MIRGQRRSVAFPGRSLFFSSIARQPLAGGVLMHDLFKPPFSGIPALATDTQGQ